MARQGHESSGDFSFPVERIELTVLGTLLLFAAVTLLLTFTLAYVIFSPRFKLRGNSFFTICAIGYFFNTISLLSLDVGKTFATLGWMPSVVTQASNTARILHFALFFARCGELHTTVFTALNRMTALLMPSRYEQIWSSRTMLGIVIYQISISIAVGAVGAISDASWIHDGDGGFYPQHRISDFGKLMFSGLLTCSIVFICLISISYTVAYAKLRSTLKTIAQYVVNNRSERSLTYVAIVTCAVEVLYYAVFAYVFIIAKDVESHPRTFHLILAIQGNIASGIHPYLLLIFSDLARNAVLRCLFDVLKYTRLGKNQQSTIHDASISF